MAKFHARKLIFLLYLQLMAIYQNQYPQFQQWRKQQLEEGMPRNLLQSLDALYLKNFYFHLILKQQTDLLILQLIPLPCEFILSFQCMSYIHSPHDKIPQHPYILLIHLVINILKQLEIRVKEMFLYMVKFVYLFHKPSCIVKLHQA